MKKILKADFFNRPTLIVAKELIGKFIVRKINGQEIGLMINETESYDGFNDLASHAHRGETPRNKIMFGDAGYIYVYFTYGMHWMLNLVTREKGYPAAVLIRGVGEFNGPAKLTKALSIDKSLNSFLLSKKSHLWIEDRGVVINPKDILATPRIGIRYAGPIWSKKKHRFVLKKERP